MKAKKIDYDNKYGVQCVDLIDWYIVDFLKLKKGFSGNAKEWQENYSNSEWLKKHFNLLSKDDGTLKYKKNGELKKGDIGICTTMGDVGHVFLIAGSSKNGKIKCYEQHGYNHSPVTKHYYLFNSSNITGVLRPKPKKKKEEKKKK